MKVQFNEKNTLTAFAKFKLILLKVQLYKPGVAQGYEEWTKYTVVCMPLSPASLIIVSFFTFFVC